MKGTKFQSVGLFVDWNTQILDCPPEFKDKPIEKCRLALQKVGKKTTKLLCNLDVDQTYKVSMRVYHGWTAGTNQTENRRAFLNVPEYINPDEIYPSTRVLASGYIEFGDRLLYALPERENKGLRIHLPNTLRRQGSSSAPVEKMVDTALASDLLCWAKDEPTSIALVFSNDDDVVPPVFVAEAWMKPMGGSLYLIRSPIRGDSRYLSLEGLLK